MKKWFRRLTIIVPLVGLTLGVLYEVATHVGRGWLYGEAFYEGRPTSYWRVRCDEWMERFDTPEDAAHWIPPGIAVPMLDEDGPWHGDAFGIRERPQNMWSRLMDRFRSDEDRLHEDWPPKVLFGFPGAEPVLEELIQEQRYRLVAERGLKHAKIYRKMGHEE